MSEAGDYEYVSHFSKSNTIIVLSNFYIFRNALKMLYSLTKLATRNNSSSRKGGLITVPRVEPLWLKFIQKADLPSDDCLKWSSLLAPFIKYYLIYLLLKMCSLTTN